MLRQNLWLKGGLVNGSIGTGRELIYEGSQGYDSDPAIVLVDFPSYCGPAFDRDNPTFVPIGRTSTSEIPLNLAFASTVHKAQGSTLNRATVDIGSEFSLGIAYVAFSRIKTLSGLRINEEFSFGRLANLHSKWMCQARETEWMRLNALEITTVLYLKSNDLCRNDLCASMFEAMPLKESPIKAPSFTTEMILKEKSINEIDTHPNKNLSTPPAEYTIKPTDRYTNQLLMDCPILEPYLLRVYNPDPDGNCGPRAIAIHVYNGDQSRCPEVRRNMLQVVLADEMYYRREVQNQFFFGPCGYADLIQRLSYTGTQPTSLWFHLYPDFTIAATSYNRPMIVIGRSNGVDVCMPRNRPSSEWTVADGPAPLYFAHINGNHYLALDVRDPYNDFKEMRPVYNGQRIEIDDD
jgi:hypothetical protein